MSIRKTSGIAWIVISNKINGEEGKAMFGKMPFLFFVPADYSFTGQKQSSNPEQKDYWIVIVALIRDYKVYDAAWMNDPKLPANQTLVPDVALEESSHKFYSEAEAVAFIREWWRKN